MSTRTKSKARENADVCEGCGYLIAECTCYPGHVMGEPRTAAELAEEINGPMARMGNDDKEAMGLAPDVLDPKKIYEAALAGGAVTEDMAYAIADAIAEYHRQITEELTIEGVQLNDKQAAALESFGNESPLCLIPDLHAPKCNCGERTKTPSVSGPETIGS